MGDGDNTQGSSSSPHLGPSIWLHVVCFTVCAVGELTLSCCVDLHNVVMAGLDLLHRGALVDCRETKSQRSVRRFTFYVNQGQDVEFLEGRQLLISTMLKSESTDRHYQKKIKNK